MIRKREPLEFSGGIDQALLARARIKAPVGLLTLIARVGVHSEAGGRVSVGVPRRQGDRWVRKDPEMGLLTHGERRRRRAARHALDQRLKTRDLELAEELWLFVTIWHRRGIDDAPLSLEGEQQLPIVVRRVAPLLLVKSTGLHVVNRHQLVTGTDSEVAQQAAVRYIRRDPNDNVGRIEGEIGELGLAARYEGSAYGKRGSLTYGTSMYS